MVMTVRFLLLWLVLLFAAVGALLGLLAVTRQRVAVTQRAAGAHAQRAADAAHAAVARVVLAQLLVDVLDLVDALLQLVRHLAQLLHRAHVLHVDPVLHAANQHYIQLGPRTSSAQTQVVDIQVDKHKYRQIQVDKHKYR